MAKWDIDKQILTLEPPYSPGTTISRMMLAITLCDKYGIKISPKQREKEDVYVWCLAIGLYDRPKAFFYATTIRSAFLAARKAVKLNILSKHNPWGEDPFPLQLPKRHPKKKQPRLKKKAKS